jgi:hypothetical protein
MRVIEVDNKKDLKDFEYFLQNAISRSNELKVIRKFGLILKSRMKNYDTSDEQELKLSCSGVLTENQKKCIKIKIYEKRVIRELLEFVSFAEKVLESGKISNSEKYGKYITTLKEII